MRIIIDGEKVSDADAVISVFDLALVRGHGCFEVARSYRGRVFRLAQHLDRLERSASIMSLELPPRAELAQWMEAVAAEGGDGQIRCMVTPGGTDPLFTAPPRTVVSWEPLPVFPTPLRLLPRHSPWHPAGRQSELNGAKTLSYAPNVAATRAAVAAGFHDALLVSPDEIVLEGPSWSIAWFDGDRLETPSLDLHILASITRAVVIEVASAAGFEVVEGAFTLDRLNAAAEVVALSTLKEVHPVGTVGDATFGPGAATARLREAFRTQVDAEVGP